MPSLSRAAAVLDAEGGMVAVESRLGALVLCVTAVLFPADPSSALMSVRPLAVAHRLGSDATAVRRSLESLARVGLLGLGDDARGPEDAVAITPSWERVAAPPVANVVDWPAIVERLAGHPAALGVALAFAESTVAPGEQTPITVPQLVAGARYSDRTVKGALSHLVDAGVLVRGPRIGARGRYAFSDAALGLLPFPGGDAAPADVPDADPERRIEAELSALRAQVDAIGAMLSDRAPGPAASTVPPAVLASGPADRSERPAPHPDGRTAYLELHGTRIALPPGATLQLESDAAGHLWYRMGGVRFGPIVP